MDWSELENSWSGNKLWGASSITGPYLMGRADLLSLGILFVGLMGRHVNFLKYRKSLIRGHSDSIARTKSQKKEIFQNAL